MSSRKLVSDHLIKGINVNFLSGYKDSNFPVFLVCVYKACEQKKIKLLNLLVQWEQLFPMTEGDTFNMLLSKSLGSMPLHAPQGFSLEGQKHLPFGAKSHSTVVNSNTGLFHILLKTLYVSWTFNEFKSKVRCRGLYRALCPNNKL